MRVIYFGEEHLIKVRIPGETEFSEWDGKPIYGGVFGYGEWAMVGIQYPFSNLMEIRYFVLHTKTGFPIAGNHESKREAMAKARETLRTADKAHLLGCMAEFAAKGVALDRRLEESERQKREEQRAVGRENPGKRDGSGFVYLIRCDERYKIGKANDVASRLRTMMLPAKPEIIASGHFPNAHEVERELHKHYSHCRENGEWFRLTTEEVTAATARIKQGEQGRPKLHSVA